MALSKQELLKLYGDMWLIRAFEEKVDEFDIYRSNYRNHALRHRTGGDHGRREPCGKEK